jgi:hypothetical protein
MVCLPSGDSESGHRNRFPRGSVAASLLCCTTVTSPARRTPMDALVPPDVTAELTQILSNLVLGDNEIRSKYATPHPLLHSMSHNLFLPVQRPSSTSDWLTDQMSIFSLSRSLPQEQTPSKWSVGNAPHFFYLSPFLLSSP